MTVNYTGQIFGTLLVVQPSEIGMTQTDRHQRWLCHCQAPGCNEAYVVQSNRLKHKQCKCQIKKEKKMTVNYTDQMFKTIKVLRPATLTDMQKHKPKLAATIETGRGIRATRRTSGTRNRLWLCQCVECNKETIVRSDKFKSRKGCKCQKNI